MPLNLDFVRLRGLVDHVVVSAKAIISGKEENKFWIHSRPIQKPDGRQVCAIGDKYM
jgi:hypothetical protein